MRNSIKIIGILMAALSMLLTATTFSAPDAAAHAVGGTFTHNAIERGTSCGAGFDSLGSQEIFGVTYTACQPVGYSPVGTDVELCAEAGEESRVLQIEGVCTYDRARSCGDRPDFNYQLPSGLCIRPVLILDSELAAHLAEKAPKGSLTLGTQICIEDDRVQENAQGMSVGGRFHSDGALYEIVTGGSFCSFNCEDGYDVNCDGKLGDFCPSEYDLSKVTDVGLCLDRTTAKS